MDISLLSSDALLVVDVQNDFLEGGSLAVPHANSILAVVNSYLATFHKRGLPIYASRDFHPKNHCSFVENGGQWPSHCVAGSSGAEFHPDLQLPESTFIVSKATTVEKDAYSALDGTGLGDTLKRSGITRAFVCGLATDYCVLASCKDLLDQGFQVMLLVDAIQGVNLSPEDSEKAKASLNTLGAVEITLANLVDNS